MTYEEIMDFLVDSRPVELGLDALADFFDRMIWLSSDNGREICEVRKKWILGGDRARAEIALRMEEIFPYEGRDEMNSAFLVVIERWPDFRPFCDAWLSRWDQQSQQDL